MKVICLIEVHLLRPPASKYLICYIPDSQSLFVHVCCKYCVCSLFHCCMFKCSSFIWRK